MRLFHRFEIAVKALLQLGLRQTGLYAAYQVALRTGILRRLTDDRRLTHSGPYALHPLLALPDPRRVISILGPQGVAKLRAEADEIVLGGVRLFGGEPVELDLSPSTAPPAHWTDYETHSPQHEDIKFIWEPARFGWAFTLGRAYHLAGDERYPATFWLNAETWLDSNPPNRGLHWVSAQEVSLRLMAFTFAAQVFAASVHTTPQRLACLSQSIAAHAARIPPTLTYARAQNNNHLLSESAGLITAGLALPDHPQASRWLALGQKWFSWGIEQQIAADGAYIQHSANYHRLMLQLALWVNVIARCAVALRPLATKQSSVGEALVSGASRPCNDTLALALATRWLLALCDPGSGRVPNLGPNDGAYILPLTICPFDDYRPVLQTAAQVFLGQPAFDVGAWNEMALWLGAGEQGIGDTPASIPYPISHLSSPHVLRPTRHTSWAYLRVAQFHSRPGHADQLHLDLWWRGLNVAQDAGTYRYTAISPWDNRLSSAFVHNTVTINGQDQMTRAGKFLYLDWAQAEMVDRQQAEDGSWQRLTAQHDGYRRLGVIHRRIVTAFEDGRWLVEDILLPTSTHPLSSVMGRLHWLLPDWPFEWLAQGCGLQILASDGPVTCRITSPMPNPPALNLIRSGQLIRGPGPAAPILGWTSPMYGHKIPALSLVVDVHGPLPVQLTSEWVFPKD